MNAYCTNYLTLICFCLSFSFTNCNKESTLPIPEIERIVFADANTVEVDIKAIEATTDKVNVLVTDLQGNTFEFTGFNEGSITLNTLPAGNAYTFQLQLERDGQTSDFSKKSPPILASAFQDSNFNRIEMLQKINQARQAAQTCGSELMPAVGHLVWNDLLENAAEIHSLAMDTQNFFGHTNPATSEQLDSRLRKVNYPFRRAFENIAKDYNTLDKVMNAWIESEAHCKNLMDSSVKEVGAFKQGVYWTQVLCDR